MAFYSWLRHLVALMGLALLCGGAVHAQSQPCAPELLGSWVAKEVSASTRPAKGWVPVALPQTASAVWPDWQAAVWYRLDWRLHCPSSREHAQLALAISGIRMAGTVYWNDEQLWSDRSLVEPLSRSWNMPRWWPVTIKNREEVQTAWVRVVAVQADAKGLGYVRLDNASVIQEQHAQRYWRQRTSYVLTAGLSAAIACVALMVWLWRRSEPVYLWMGLMQVCWTVYLAVILSTEPWPGLSTKSLSMLNLIAFMLYAHCFLVFILRFGGQRLRRFEACAWMALGLWIALMLPAQYVLPRTNDLSMIAAAIVFNGSCWYFIYKALRSRETQHLLLALFCLVMTIVGLHDLVVALRRWDNDQTWAFFMWPLNMVVLAMLLGWQVASHMRRIDGFNAELTDHVAQARAELAQALAREHAQALQNAKMQERVQLAHDLHDGLGGSLVRSMALVEQAPQPLSNERVMSLLKTLRDDLRQVIDTGSSAAVQLPDTPTQWLAPLRHRIMRIADELNMRLDWQVADAWQRRPDALQAMGPIRFLEEAFTNVLKHSQARTLWVCCHQPEPDELVLSVQDDGQGFDVQAVMDAGMSVGMRSMQARIARIGGQLTVQSRPGSTVLTVRLRLKDVKNASVLEAVSA